MNDYNGKPPKLKYKVISVSSEDVKHPVSELMYARADTKGWQTAKLSDPPHELVLQFEQVSRITHVSFLSHHYKIATKVELFAGMPNSAVPLPAVETASWTRLGMQHWHQRIFIKWVYANEHHVHAPTHNPPSLILISPFPALHLLHAQAISVWIATRSPDTKHVN